MVLILMSVWSFYVPKTHFKFLEQLNFHIEEKGYPNLIEMFLVIIKILYLVIHTYLNINETVLTFRKNSSNCYCIFNQI